MKKYMKSKCNFKNLKCPVCSKINLVKHLIFILKHTREAYQCPICGYHFLIDVYEERS